MSSRNAKVLTDVAARNMKRGEDRSDGGTGLHLRATSRGKVWRWIFRREKGAKQEVRILGEYKPGADGHMSLTDARNRLEALKAALREGRLEEELPSEQPGTPVPTTVRELAEVFYTERIIPRRVRPEQVRDILDREIIPRIGHRTLAGFSTAACSRVVEAVVARGATTFAWQVLSLLKQLGRYGQGRSWLSENPAEPLDPDALGCTSDTCDRCLTVEEIEAWWKALDSAEMSIALRNGLRLLLLTGLRTGALRNARWENVDFEGATLTVPITDQKLGKKAMRTARPFVVPLAPLALDLLREIQATQKLAFGESAWVMRGWGEDDAPVDEKAFVHAMARLWAPRREGGRTKRKGVRRGKQAEAPALLTMEYATPHDLRRTMRTHYEATLGIEPHVAERALNHSLGKVFNTYSRGDYLPARVEAAARWADFVERTVRGEKARVVSIKSA